MASNIAASGASYEAVVIDLVTQPVDRIIQSLGRLEAAFQGVTQPARELATAMNAVRGSMEVPRAQQAAGAMAGLAAGLTKVRTAALSVGQGLSQGLNTLASGFKAASASAGIFAAAGIAAIVNFTQASSRAQETQSKFNVVFGAGAVAANAWAKSIAGSLGRSENAVKEFTATSKAMLSSAGFDDAMSTEMSKALTTLTIDLASFHDEAEDDVFQRLISGMNGSTEALERFGINLKASAIDEKLLNMGLDLTNKKLTENEKKYVRMIMLLEATSDAQTDASRTANSFANQVKSLGAAWDTFRVSIGTIMQDQLLPYIQRLNDLFVAVSVAIKKFGTTIVKTFVTAVGVAAAVSAAFLAIGVSLTALAGIVITVSTAVSGLVAVLGLVITAPILAVVGAVGAAVVSFGSLAMIMGNIREIDPVGLFNDMSTTLQNVAAEVTAAFDAIVGAIASGDYASAFEIIGLEAKLMAAQVSDDFANAIFSGIRNGWEQAKDWLKGIASAKVPVIWDLSGKPAELNEYQKQIIADAQRLGQLKGQYGGKGQQVRTDATAQIKIRSQNIKDEMTARLQAADAAKKAEEDKAAAEKKATKAATKLARDKEKAESVLAKFDTPAQALMRTTAEINTAFSALPKTAENLLRYNRGLAESLQTYNDAVKPAKETRSAFYKSTGSTASGFASRIGSFAGTVDVGKETKKQTKLQDEIKGNTKETADMLTKIANTVGWTW